MSELRFVRVSHHGCEAVERHVLAMHRLRRYLECVTDRYDSESRVQMAMTSFTLLRALRELIAALDRRVPNADRAGESSIVRDSDALKARAMQRIGELEDSRRDR